jgi:hypothetical protein
MPYLNNMEMHAAINKFLPFAILYFFFNSLFLPTGLLYTTLLTPLFLYWIYKQDGVKYVWLFFMVTLPLACIHFINGVNVQSYIKSYTLLFTAFVFGVAFYLFLKRTNTIRAIFDQIIIWNFLLAMLALLLLSFGIRAVFWYIEPISTGITDIPRLKMFTYEASYYSLLMVPLVLYYYLKVLLLRTTQPVFKLLLVTLPLILSFSFGVLLGLGLSMFFLFWSDINLFFVKKKFPRYILVAGLLLLLVFIILVKFYPDNPVFKRFANVFEGNDSSFKGRTTDSFFLGWKMASMKSILFGCGPGQIRELGLETFTNFYQHSFTPQSLNIPNSLGETLAMYGVLGLFSRLAIEIYLFFKTKVYSNYYRISLYLFVFIYQFTGSFLNNIAEYVIWILAFTPGFFEFDKKSIRSNLNL